MKRFDIDDDIDSSETNRDETACPVCGENKPQPWPGFDPAKLPQVEWPIPQVPPKVQQTISIVIREAIETGLSLHETYARISAILARHGLSVSDDDLSGMVGSQALALS